MSPRKRRRDQAFPDDEEMETETHPTEEDTALSDKQRAEKEQEIWDAIREAHYEAIEQLPLTLQRQLSLMLKLDQQSFTLTARLLPTLQRYIKQRRAMAGISEHEHQAEATDEQASTSSPIGDAHFPPGRSNGESRSSPRTPTPGSVPPELQKAPETTRELVSHVAWMSEELLRASQEKVNLAQTNHDSVERHIRLLDQAIKEQEASLAMDKSRSTARAAVHLPELVVPEWPRKNRNTYITDDGLDGIDGDQAIFVTETQTEHLKGSQRASKKKGKERNKIEQDDQAKDSASLTITLPAATQQGEESAVQPNEELYCYCNRVSFGQMIACDNESCEREWFHLGCVGLTEIPEGEWYCEDCRVDEI
ncbi:hypothetical protein BDZ97DRAFT_1660868 [Flammula alnicola]|nr:hypothetical protein BDZ97DRAFT_1660868 [Flammula alnicola]